MSYDLVDPENEALLQILEEDEKLFTGDAAQLDNISVKIPYLHGKYMSMLFRERERYELLKSQLDSIYGELYHHYRFDSQYDLQRTEVDLYVKKDKRYVKPAYKVNMSKQRMQMLQDAIDGLKTKSFAIKHAIDYMKFKNGLS